MMNNDPLATALRSLAAMIDQGEIDTDSLDAHTAAIAHDDDSGQLADLFSNFYRDLTDL